MERLVGSSVGCRDLANFVGKRIGGEGGGVRGNDKVLSFEERLLGCMHYCGNKNAQYEVNKAVHFYEGEGAGDGEDEEGGAVEGELMREHVRKLVL